MQRQYLCSRTAAFLTFLTFLLACGLGCQRSTLAAEPSDLAVMTFNIRYGTANDGENRWENRTDLVFDVVRRHDPDIVGLQEALRFQIDEMLAALPEYGEIGVGRDDGKMLGEYSAILYRKDRLRVVQSNTFWFSDTPGTPGSASWGNRIPRICTWGRFVHKASGKAFYMFNVHLDHQSQPSRERSAVLLAQRIAGRELPAPVIVTGDFNAAEDNPAVQYLKGERPLVGAGEDASKTPVVLVDSFRVLHPEAEEVGTFNRFKGDRSGPKIDYVFTQPGIKVLRADIVQDTTDGRCPSDHFPVTAELRLAAGAGD